MRILITGSRDWTDIETMIDAMGPYIRDIEPRSCTIVHGGARGADSIAGEIGHTLGVNVEVHPADWNKHGKAAGPIRNQQMVDLGADICLAFPKGESRGTRHCMRAAEKAGIEVVNYGER